MNYSTAKYKLPKAKYTLSKRVHYSVSDVKPSKKTHNAPLLTISYDIECDSSHGDFPLASKNYKKLAAELLDNINARFKRVIQDKDLTTVIYR